MAKHRKRSAKSSAPIYTPEEARAIRQCGGKSTVRQPDGTAQAALAVNETQRNRVVGFKTDKRMVRGSEERVDASRVAMVSTLPDALRVLPERALQGLEAYQEIWEAAQPSQVPDYSPRIPGGEVEREPDTAAMGRLVEVNRALGPRVAPKLEWAMRLGRGDRIGEMALAFLSVAGERVLDVVDE